MTPIHPPAGGKTRHWFERWFNEHYLSLYRHRDLTDANRQIRLMIDTIKPAPENRILDLGCGEGRHVSLIKAQGLDVSGIDLSETLITIGKSRHPELSLCVGDMRRIQGKWDIILSLFTSFGYFDDDQENRNVMSSIAAALNPGGWFWIDFLNPDHVVANLVPESVRKLDDRTKAIEHRRIDGNMVVKDIRLQLKDGEEHYQERVFLYRRDDLEAMMDAGGIDTEGAFGDYDGNLWTQDSPRTIVYGRKHER